jgi:enoyl-CoA hydratase/carnithine racemase
MLSYAWGEPVAFRASLLGEIFTCDQAHALGVVREPVPARSTPNIPVDDQRARLPRAPPLLAAAQGPPGAVVTRTI